MSRMYWSVVQVDNNVSLKMANLPRSVLGAVDQRLGMQVSAGLGVELTNAQEHRHPHRVPPE
jgi:hypothetical protein